ncbi:hypothetical protein K1T71_008438 [Dendrolimus kikuchii]|uniref:Uncharacterized protein n=1 Tax=Dendrolimus kikuchii TaxID=765133 RepID=A0ACC1CX14_9NEOP|nr:hypothetical protein K1T71_008438 [Dendrolimus kikuchii]
MPKKAPRNAFYFYMLDFKEEQRLKGIHYANMKEVADAANPSWQKSPPSVRTKYEAKAKAEKQKTNTPNQKYTSTGISFAEIDQMERELKEAEYNEREDIKNLVKFGKFNQTTLDLDFYLMDVNYSSKFGSDYLIGEMTLLRFSLRDGIKDYYPEEINPVQLGLVLPFIGERTVYPLLLFKVLPIQNFIMQLCRNAGEDDSLFRVYKLDFLFFTLINGIRTKEDEGFPKESLALVQLKKDVFKYTPRLGCKHHEEIDKSVMCTSSRTKRWAYTVLDSCCPLIDVQVQPGKHVPHDYDMESIMLFKEQRKVSATPYLEVIQGPSSSSTMSQVSSYSDAAAAGSSHEGPKKEKRVHVPLRMPRTDCSGLAGSMKNLRLNK